ncbi:hypothetical protein PA7_11060 [Pseudonocardia asaccharolytica DSM 44247 = NBRC 16224]|uniref:Bacterial transcriptional activator domain-containing protein n=1 Tax=Pseudonocardia asaccharolytica DSM 44247 = NBRC 16224 TaxID=1123024 RepID=A0A511CXI4_9PSEU|nr:hypothetical protein PA7_11060 [Pseudonocardia asaccharolytica DSM 44247 = NBRC 16224]
MSADPLREGLSLLLARALQDLGRTAEALRALDGFRRRMADDSGLDPSPALADLRRRLLAGGRTPRPPPAPTGSPESRRRVAGGKFVGRRVELGRLLQRVGEADSGRGGVVLVAGEPGIGKTRLLAELDAVATRRGALVLSGRCLGGAGAGPYHPFADALKDLLAAGHESTPADLAAVAPLLPRRARPAAEQPSGPRLQPDELRLRLLDAVVRFLLSPTRTRTVVVTIDDLHWAESSTIAMLRHVARSTRDARLVLIGAYRGSELAADHPLSDALAELRSETECTAVQLGGLEPYAVDRLLGATAGRPLAAALPGAHHGVEPALEAADLARTAGAHDEDARFLRLARELAPPGDSRLPELLARSAIALAWSLRFDEAVTVGRAAVEATARDSGSAAVAAEIATTLAAAGSNVHAWQLTQLGLGFAELEAWADQASWAALTLLDLDRREATDPANPGIPLDVPERRRALWILSESGRLSGRADLGRYAMAAVYGSRARLPDDAADDPTVALLLVGDFAAALPRFAADAVAAQSRGQLAWELYCRSCVARCHTALGDLAAATAALGAADALAARVPTDRMSWQLTTHIGARDALAMALDTGWEQSITQPRRRPGCAPVGRCRRRAVPDVGDGRMGAPGGSGVAQAAGRATRSATGPPVIDVGAASTAMVRVCRSTNRGSVTRICARPSRRYRSTSVLLSQR